MDEDFALALRLQLEEDEQLKEIRKESSGSDVIQKTGLKNGLSRSSGLMSNSLNSKPLSIVDEEWELIDPVPNIIDLFLQFNEAYFDGLLAGVEVKWSSRMTLCAGLCSYEGRGGLCSIRLSQPLLKLRPRKDLVQTLLHEMIHAVLFVTHNNKDHDSHGPEFLKHMHRINKQTGTNITVYHNFHDEVNNYRQHWWRCDGPCQKRPPYYGIVRRAMNRAPSKNDTWWADHMRTCGGKYTKIKEPEDYGKKNSKRKREQNSDSNKEKETENLAGSTKKSISFSGKGKALGGSDNGKISKWFKPVEEVKDVSTKQRSPLKSISEAVVDEKQKDGGKEVASDVGNVLGGEKASMTNGRAAWIERLMRKQEEAIERRNKLSNGLKVKGNKKVESIGNKVKRQADISSAFAKINKKEKDNSCTVTQTANVLNLDDDDVEDGDFRFDGKGMKNGISIDSSIKGNTASTTQLSVPNRPFSALSSSAMASISSSSSPSRSWNSSSSSTSTLSSSLIASSSLSSSSSPHSFTSSSSSTSNPSSSISSSSSRSFASSSSSSSTPSSSLSSSSSRSWALASSSSMIPSSSLSPLSSSSSHTSKAEPNCRGFQIISSSICETPSTDSIREINNDKSNISRFSETRPTQIVLDDSFTSNSGHEELVSCPVCPKKVSIHSINLHLDECLSRAS